MRPEDKAMCHMEGAQVRNGLSEAARCKDLPARLFCFLLLYLCSVHAEFTGVQSLLPVRFDVVVAHVLSEIVHNNENLTC